jgi:hypothetical protein
MKILFVYKGRYHIRDTVTIEYLSSIAHRHGHTTGLVYDQDLFGVTDNVFSQRILNRLFSSDKDVLARIERSGSDAAVFFDGLNRSRWNAGISAAVKRAGMRLSTVCVTPWETDTCGDSYDHILIGEPELSFERFLSGASFSGPGGVHRFGGVADLDSLPFPDQRFFERYTNFRASYPIYTSKGCIYGCSYCEETVFKREFGPDYVRRRDPGKVISELKEAKRNFGIREVMYKDSIFTLDKEWLRSYLEIYRSEIGLPYKCFGRAEVFDDEIASMLKESGCYCLEFGAQTFNEGLKRRVLSREETTGTLLGAFGICDRKSIRYDVDHIFGIPGESTEDHKAAARIYAGLDHINRIKCHNLTYYRRSDIYGQAPASVRGDGEFSTDFFSGTAGEGEMIKVNRAFQKYFKILPALPREMNDLIIKGDRWRLFNYFPYPVVVFFMALIAIKNGDRRFGVYMKYYPRKIVSAFWDRVFA